MQGGAESGTALQLIVGLGNPGRAYKNTRHNIGFMVLDRLVSSRGCNFKREGRPQVAREFSTGRIFLKPMNYMNLSGQDVSRFARYYKVLPQQILIVLDDIALPLGRLRIRQKGSAGGHNGLASVLTHLSTEAVPRLRIGVGAPENCAMADYVLGNFSHEEAPLVEEAVNRACQAIEVLTSQGIEAAMNQFNPPP